MPETNSIPTLSDVAKAAGVSTATVSRCLNSPDRVVKATRDRVLGEVARLGYTPNFGARAMAAKRTHTIGAIIPTMDNAIFARGLQAFQQQLHTRGYTLLVASSAYQPDIEEDQIRSLVARGADGLLLIGYERDPALYDYLAARDVPALAAWVYEQGNSQPSIGFDNAASMYALAETVWDHGHRRIGVISGTTRGNDRAIGRLNGLRAAFADKGLPPENLTIIETPYGIKSGGKAFFVLDVRISSPDRYNVRQRCARRRRHAQSPQDETARAKGWSITGFDDIELARIVSPELTTVHVPHRKMGREAANTLIDMVETRQPAKSIELQSTIKLRASLAKIKPET